MKIKKEFIPFIIALAIICFNMPAIILLNFFKPELMEKFAITIVPIECIFIGLTIIYTDFEQLIKIKSGHKECVGVIIGSKFKYRHRSWLKTPIVSYNVNGTNYQVDFDVGIKGIFSFNWFLKGKKVKVYYNEEKPEDAYMKNYLTLIVGSLFTIVGIVLLIML